MLKIFDLAACAPAPMENGRGETIRLINTGTRHREDRSASQPPGAGRPARHGASAFAIRQRLYRAPRRGNADGGRCDPTRSVPIR